MTVTVLDHIQMKMDFDRRGEPIEDEHASTLQFAAYVVDSNTRNGDEPWRLKSRKIESGFLPEFHIALLAL